jgi:DNA-binding NarL/FixJ family response regulator
MAGDAAGAIARRTQSERPDVALVDIRLIGPRDGIDAAEEILRRFGVPSLFVTANTDPDTRGRAQAVEPLGFLEKPLAAQRLRVALRAVP